MKTIITLAFITLVSLTPAVANNLYPSVISKKPTTGAFNFFRAHRQGVSIALSWSSSSADVVQFIVERSYDGDFYEQIGSTDAKVNTIIRFTDKIVYPGFIYYRIAALKADGTTEHSSVETVRIVRRR